MIRLKLSLLFLLQMFPFLARGQQYWATTGSIPSVLYSVQIDCPCCEEAELIDVFAIRLVHDTKWNAVRPG
jgi:hypothetical protein